MIPDLNRAASVQFDAVDDCLYYSCPAAFILMAMTPLVRLLVVMTYTPTLGTPGQLHLNRRCWGSG